MDLRKELIKRSSSEAGFILKIENISDKQLIRLIQVLSASTERVLMYSSFMNFDDKTISEIMGVSTRHVGKLRRAGVDSLYYLIQYGGYGSAKISQLRDFIIKHKMDSENWKEAVILIDKIHDLIGNDIRKAPIIWEI